MQAAETTRIRGDSYGPPPEHFARTVGAINVMFSHKLKEPLIPEDWGMFMILDKIARDQTKKKDDTVLDIIGYGACIYECRVNKETKQ
jgi:hypothetical protein